MSVIPEPGAAKLRDRDVESAIESDVRGFPNNVNQNVHSGNWPENLRTAATLLIAFLLLTHALYIAAAVLIPIVAAAVLALALRPIVRRLTIGGVPEVIAALLTLATVFTLILLLASQIIAPASEWIARTPIRFKIRQLERKLEPLQGSLESFHAASKEISDAVEKSTTTTPEESADAPQPVVVKPKSLVSELLNSTWQASAGLLLALVLTFFFLAKGESLIDRIGRGMHIASSTSTVSGESAIAFVEKSVSRYLLTVTVINSCLGICVALALWIIGVPNAMLWGVMATLLNFLPYIGGLIGAGVVSLVSLFAFDSIAYAALAPVAYLLLTAVEGNFVTPSILGRSMSLNPLIVILSLTYWTWLWGAAGAILAVPLLAIFVSACRQFDGTRQLAVMLSD
ncbi:MAG: AI-2E family transporter [Planctomycetaceae bacterium]